VGIAGHDAASGARITVYAAKCIHESVADGVVNAAALLVTSPSATKDVKAAAAVTTPTPADVTTSRAIIGVALTTATDGNTVRWMQR